MRFGTDTRSNAEVIVKNERKDHCKSNRVIVAANMLSDDPRFKGCCIPFFTQFIPGGTVNSEFLCEYPNGDISWVDGKHIKIQ